MSKTIKIMLFLAAITAVAAFMHVKDDLMDAIKEEVKASIISLIEDRLETYVSVGSVDFGIRNGAVVIFSDIRTEGSKGLKFHAEKITAGISFVDLLFGKTPVSEITLERPDLTIGHELMTGSEEGPGTALPPIRIINGNMRFISDREYDFKRINGIFTGDNLKASFMFLNAEAEIDLFFAHDSINGSIAVNGFQMKNMVNAVTGKTDAVLRFQCLNSSPFPYTASLNIRAGRTSFSWCSKEIDKFSMDFLLLGNMGQVEARKFSLNTPLADFKGGFKLTDLDRGDNIENGKIDISLSSGDFEYEAVVDLLPRDGMDDWIGTLLFEQIRDGRMKLTELSYRGAFKDFTDPYRVYKNLFARGNLAGMSFGSGFGPDRVEGIEAEALCKDAGIYINNISGMAGNSRIERVDLAFPDCGKDGFKIEVDVMVDMDAADFLTAWRASLYDEELCHILDPVTDASGGRLKAEVSYSNDIDRRGMTVRGSVKFNDLSFTMYEKLFEDINGTAGAESFGSPVEVNASGRYEGLPFKSFRLSFQDIFSPVDYKFEVGLDQLPEMESFSLSENTSISLIGSGHGEAVWGDLTLRTEALYIRDNEYKNRENLFSGKGRFKGNLWPVFTIGMEAFKTGMDGSGRLELNGMFSEENNKLSLKGYLDLMSGNLTYEGIHSIEGEADLKMQWGKNLPFKAHVKSDKMQCRYNESSFTAEGSLDISEERISTGFLKAGLNGMDFIFDGGLDLGQAKHYSGEISIDGLTLGREDLSAGEFLDDITANARLILTNAEIAGLNFDLIYGDSVYEKGNFKFSNIDAFCKSGEITGMINMPGNGEPRIDLGFKLKDQDLLTLNKAIAPERDLMSGSADIEGRVHGRSDSLNGEVSFLGKNGYILENSLISRIFGALNIYKMIKSGKLGLGEKIIPFNTLSATMDLRDSIIYTDDFYLDNNQVPASFIGEYDITEKKIKGDMTVQILESIDKMMSMIPVFGWVLTGEKEELMVIELKVEGEIDNPDVVIEPLDTLSTPVAKSLLRLLKLPVTIFTKPLKLVPVIKD